MKRHISILLSLILVVSNLPLFASALETNNERDSLIELACIVFPEFSNEITAPFPTSMARNGSERTLIYSETRNVSETELLSYSEYSDGIILLTDFSFKKTQTINSLETSAYAYHYDVTIKATCTNVAGYFKLSNVKYSLFNNSYDVITSTGNASVDGYCTIDTVFSPIMNETSSQNARIMYRLLFQVGPTGGHSFNSLLTLTVGDDNATLTHVNNT